MSHATQLHDRGDLADYRQIMRRCSLPGNGQDEVYHQVHARALETVKWTLEQALDEEVRAYLVHLHRSSYAIGLPIGILGL
jgi:hypothetical protein